MTAGKKNGPTRKRAQHKNSHGGCGTCKQRHVKCDETKPTCLRCQRAGRECVTDVAPVYKPRTFRGFKMVTPPDLSVSSTSPPELADQAYYAYFTERSLPILSSFEPSLLWDHVERLIHDDSSAIRQIAVAIGCQHMSMSSNDEALSADADRIYGDAMGVLRNAMEHASPSTINEVLIASLLLAVLQALRGSMIESLVHLHGGINIAKEQLDNVQHPTFKECLRFLEKLALKITVSESRSEAAGMAIRLVYVLWTSLPEDLYTVGIIKTEADALIVEHEIQRGLMSMIFAMYKDRKTAHSTPSNLLADGSAVVELLKGKQSKLEAYLASALAATNPDRDLDKWTKHSFALARSLLVKIFLKSAFDGRQVAYDLGFADYARITELVEDVLLRSDRSCVLQDISTIAFCFGLGPVTALAMVSSGCRDRTTRRKALSLFDRGPPCEGTWSADKLRRICEARMLYEERKASEANCVSDIDFGIPESCRVHYHVLDESETAEFGPKATAHLFRKTTATAEHFTEEAVEY